MKVILLKAVPKLGDPDDVVEVADGYARNYLIPRGLATEATQENLNRIRQKKDAERMAEDRERRDHEKVARKIEGYTLMLTVRAGEEGRLFGSVTTQDIAKGLKDTLGVKVDRRKIDLDEPIKQLGTYPIEIKLYPGVSANIKVDVLAERS